MSDGQKNYNDYRAEALKKAMEEEARERDRRQKEFEKEQAIRKQNEFHASHVHSMNKNLGH